MNTNHIIIAFAALLFVQCTPKSATVLEDKTGAEPSSQDLSWRSEAPEAGPARKIEMGDFNVMTLDNGLTVIVVENHKLPRVSYSLSLKNDPILEGDKSGLVGFAGDLFGRGTSNRTKAEIDASMDFVGASFSTGGTGMFGSSLTKHQDAVLEVMTDVLYNASFPQEEFDKILTQALSGIETIKTDPNSMAGNVASVVNYGSDHPYGEVQTAESYNNITVADCKAYIDQYFKANNAYLTIVGDITVDEAKSQAEKYFGKWESGEIPSSSYPSPERPVQTRVCIANKEGAVQSVIRVTYPVENKPGNPDILPSSVMNSILGGGIFSGRLMQNLREDKAFTYGARSSLSSDPLVGTFNAFASVRTEVTDSSVVEFLYEMERIASEPVSDYDLMLSKNSLAGSFARSLESPQTLANFARNIQRYNLPEDYYETYLERLEAVTIEDIQRVAKKYVTPDRANIVIVGNKDEIAEKLLGFDGDGEIEYYDAFGKKLENNNLALPDDMTAEIVINDYLNALGGEAKLKDIKTMEVHMSMALMGQEFNIEQFYWGNNKYYMKIGNGQMMLQEMTFDGTKLKSAGMQGSEVLTEGPGFEEAKSNARMFSQMFYTADEGYSLELKSIEDVEGDLCYRVAVTDLSGKQTTEYYSMKTNLLKRTLQTSQGPGGQEMTIINNYDDYKEVNGILIPHKQTTVGAMPVPIEMNMVDVKVNESIDESIFDIE